MTKKYQVYDMAPVSQPSQIEKKNAFKSKAFGLTRENTFFNPSLSV